MSWHYTATSYRGGYSRLVPWLLNAWNLAVDYFNELKYPAVIKPSFKATIFSKSSKIITENLTKKLTEKFIYGVIKLSNIRSMMEIGIWGTFIKLEP